MTSVWTKSTTIKNYSTLNHDIETDVAIIGGGMCGLLTAYLLRERGYHAVVLEADRIASGQTKNTTAKITAQHGLIYHHLLNEFGIKRANQYAHANIAAIEEYHRIIAKTAIRCGFTGNSAYLYATGETEPIEKEYQAAKDLGINCYLTEETFLPFPVSGSLVFTDQAMFNPLQFIAGIIDKLVIYEQTPVTEIREDMVLTASHKIKCRYSVVATHYPFINVPGWYFLRMHQERSYVIAVTNAPPVNGMYLGIDGNQLSFRDYGNFVLLAGAGHRTGENKSGGRYAQLYALANKLWPGSQIHSHWSAQDCITADHVPFIGKYSNVTPTSFVATGFHKWGMTGSMVAAMIIRDLITDKENFDAEIFSPQRFSDSSGWGQIIKDGGKSIQGLAKEFLTPASSLDYNLPVGHGGIINNEGKQIGIYRDAGGVFHKICPKCTHLGCRVEWNPDEKTWDCPCHGSRFSYTGALISGPAQKGLEVPDDTKE